MKKFIMTEPNGRVQVIHYMPFDEKDGLGKTEEELLEEGYLVDEVPEPEQLPNKIATMMYTEEKGFWFEYAEVALSREAKLADMLASGIITQEEFDYLVGQ